jgi:L-asparaginase/N4-(beta-N-acetylglucosaminyl)-L-asparaginase
LYPISVARQVMEQTAHNLLAGEGADRFAAQQGLETGELLTASAKSRWNQWCASDRNTQPVANVEENHDTIGVLAIDARGVVTAGCSTSGISWKLPGRVGDSPIIGQGLYADAAFGAAVCTGHGELAAGVCAAFLAVETLRRGASPLDAATEVLKRIRHSYRLGDQDQIGIIVLDSAGNFSTGSLRQGYKTAVRAADRDEIVEPDVVLL